MLEYGSLFPGLRATAVEVAEAAAEHIRRRRPEVFGGIGVLRRFDAGDAVYTKSTPSDPVTVLDTETETLIRDMLLRRRPEDAVIGEETGAASGSSPVRWLVDPIDGTVNFLYAIPAYAVSIAAQIGGRTVAGAVVDVTGRMTYSAAFGYGATRAEGGTGLVDLHPSTADSLSMALVATGFGYDAGRRSAQGKLLARLLGHIRDVRRLGSAALDLCLVAAGSVDGHYEHGLNPWDWAAASLIAAEGGAVVSVPPADTTAPAGEIVMACAPGIADELRFALDRLGGLQPIPIC